MIGVIINCLTVIAGCIIGTFFKKFIPEKLTDGIMTGIGLCTLYIGIDGALVGENTLVLILSISIGACLGYILDIDEKINKMSDYLVAKFSKSADTKSASQGIVTACLVFCVGSMTLVGCIKAGISGDNTLLITKAVLDLVTSIALSATFGISVIFSSVFVLIFQGAIVLLSTLAGPVLTLPLQNEMICAGSVIIIALGLNIMGITKIKVANYLPAMIIAPMITPLLNMLV